ncbi:hypothetical protein T484DRAFT_1788274, partial [Baffinella frigidus]
DVLHKDMWDLDLPNHLAGHKRTLLQLKFRNTKLAGHKRILLMLNTPPVGHMCTFLMLKFRNTKDMQQCKMEVSSLVLRNVQMKKEDVMKTKQEVSALVL